MADRDSTPEVVGYYFVLRQGDTYMACVRVQQDEFYGTARPTHHDAMHEARMLIAMLREEQVITKSVCACLQTAS
jgi:hypothetical protein